MARDFIAQFNITAPVYVDPKRQMYRTLGMTANKINILNPKSIFAGLKASKKGFRQNKVQGDPWQLGGVLLVTPKGDIPYIYRSSYAGDHPDVDAVIEAIQQ